MTFLDCVYKFKNNCNVKKPLNPKVLLNFLPLLICLIDVSGYWYFIVSNHKKVPYYFSFQQFGLDLFMNGRKIKRKMAVQGVHILNN